MPVFRQALPEFLRQEFRQGKSQRPPLFILDPAFVDHAFWEQQSQLHQWGALMITRAKDDVAPKQFEPKSFDW